MSIKHLVLSFALLTFSSVPFVGQATPSANHETALLEQETLARTAMRNARIGRRSDRRDLRQQRRSDRQEIRQERQENRRDFRSQRQSIRHSRYF